MRSEADIPPELLARPDALGKGPETRDLGGYPGGDERVVAVREGTFLVARFARGEPVDA